MHSNIEHWLTVSGCLLSTQPEFYHFMLWLSFLTCLNQTDTDLPGNGMYTQTLALHSYGRNCPILLHPESLWAREGHTM